MHYTQYAFRDVTTDRVICQYALAVGQSIIDEKPVDPSRFTFYEVCVLHIRIPSDEERVIIPTLTKRQLAFLLRQLEYLHLLKYKHGKFSFTATHLHSAYEAILRRRHEEAMSRSEKSDRLKKMFDSFNTLRRSGKVVVH